MKGFSPVWTFNVADSLKVLSHIEQLKGFLSMWILSWIFKVPALANFLSHFEQLKGFSPVWILSCTFNVADSLKESLKYLPVWISYHTLNSKMVWVSIPAIMVLYFSLQNFSHLIMITKKTWNTDTFVNVAWNWKLNWKLQWRVENIWVKVFSSLLFSGRAETIKKLTNNILKILYIEIEEISRSSDKVNKFQTAL